MVDAQLHMHLKDLSDLEHTCFCTTLQRSTLYSTAWKRCSAEAVFVAAVCHMYLFFKDHLMLHNTVFIVLLQNMSRATG